MHTTKLLIAVGSTLLVALACGVPCEAQPPGPFLPDPARMLERLFGPDAPEDERALAEVKISPREQAELGRQAVQAYFDGLKAAQVRVLSRGRDVEYLRKLAETVRPLMTNARSCPPLKIYLIDAPWFEARSFPEGTLVFSRGMLDMAGSEAALVGMIGHELSHLDHQHHGVRLRRMKLAQTRMAQRAGAVSSKRSPSERRWLESGRIPSGRRTSRRPTWMALAGPIRPATTRGSSRV